MASEGGTRSLQCSADVAPGRTVPSPPTCLLAHFCLLACYAYPCPYILLFAILSLL